MKVWRLGSCKNFVGNDVVWQIEHMETEMLELTNRHQYRIEREVQDLSRQLAFIKKRFKEAEEVKWTGTLTKHPLW